MFERVGSHSLVYDALFSSNLRISVPSLSPLTFFSLSARVFRCARIAARSQFWCFAPRQGVILLQIAAPGSLSLKLNAYL